MKVLSEEYGIHFAIVDTTVINIDDLDLYGFERVMERNKYQLLERIP